MKPSYSRRYRRHTTSSRVEGAFFKHENHHEHGFFSEQSHDKFFQPAHVTEAVVQRKCENCEKETSTINSDMQVQRAVEKKEEDKKLQRQPEKKEEEKVMKMVDQKDKEKDKVQKKDSGATASAGRSVPGYVSSLSGKGQSLPAQANYFFSMKMGYDFSNVRVHSDKEASQSAKGLNAKAYTVGNNIVFNEGQYNVESEDGRKLMAHELTHVIQQNGRKEDPRVLRKRLAPDESKLTVKGNVPGNTVTCLKRWTYCNAPYSPGSWGATVTYHCPIFIWPGIILRGTTSTSYVTIPDEFIGTGPRGGRLYRCRNRSLVLGILTAVDAVATLSTRMMLFPDFESCHTGFRTNLLAGLNTAFAPSGGGPSGVRVNASLPVGGFPC